MRTAKYTAVRVYEILLVHKVIIRTGYLNVDLILARCIIVSESVTVQKFETVLEGRCPRRFTCRASKLHHRLNPRRRRYSSNAAECKLHQCKSRPVCRHCRQLVMLEDTKAGHVLSCGTARKAEHPHRARAQSTAREGVCSTVSEIGLHILL